MLISMDAFNDELEKISGSLQGHVRSGKRPISADALLAKEKGQAKEKKAIITKLAWKKAALTAGAGAAMFELGRRANEDRKLGKMVRKQQGS